MVALWFSLLFMPVCAAMAGVIVWWLNRYRELEDNILFRDFLMVLIACMFPVWGIVSTDTVRMYIDPQFRLQAELDANPVYTALKKSAPDDLKILQGFLATQMMQDATLSDAFLQSRMLLNKLTNHRMGFADQKARLAWAQFSVDTLRELQAGNPALCYQVLSSQEPDPQTFYRSFSSGNTQAFQQAVIGVYESAYRGIQHEKPPEDKPVEFNDAAQEYSVIQEDVVRQYGASVAKIISKKTFPEQPVELADQMCSARIFQLEEMLKRPQAMAAMLVDSALR